MGRVERENTCVYYDLYIRKEAPLSTIAKIFKSGGSQAVRIPKQFRLPGKEVRIRKVDGGLLLEPVVTDVQEWFRVMDAYTAEHGPYDGLIEEPESPADDIQFD